MSVQATAPAAAPVRIGCSGWIYKHWRGLFYPEKLPVKRWFEFYASEFDTVEINNSFYRLPPPETFKSWREQAPAGFCYAVKANRFLTQAKKLKDCEEPLERMMRSFGALKPSLGPIAYLRFHGGISKYWGRYTDEALLGWTDWIAGQARSGRAVWAYFNNDPEAHAIQDAQTLRGMVRQSLR